MSTTNADDLEQRAAQVRAHLQSTVSELERAMHVQPEEAEKAERHPEDAAGPSTSSGANGPTSDPAVSPNHENPNPKNTSPLA